MVNYPYVDYKCLFIPVKFESFILGVPPPKLRTKYAGAGAWFM